MIEEWKGGLRRVLPNGRQVSLIPLLYGQARLLVGPLDDWGGDAVF